MARKPSDDGKPGRKRRGRGEGAVFQRKSDGLWVGTVSQGYDSNGKRVRITVYGATKAEALAALYKAKHGGVKKDRVTVGEFCKAWLEKVEGSGGCTSSTSGSTLSRGSAR